MTSAVAHCKPRVTADDEIVIVSYTDLWIFRAAGKGRDKLGQHKKMDILPGSGAAVGTMR